MGRVFRLVAVVLMLLAVPAGAVNEWVSVGNMLVRSTASVQQYVTHDDGTQSWQTVCTAFSIDEHRQLFMTAAHCLDNPIKVDWQNAWTVYENGALDLAVLQSPGVKRPALKPRTAPIPFGLDVASFGHAYGYETPQLRAGIVAHPEALIPELKQTFLVFLPAPIGGMSGGPIVDSEGKVVAITQRGNGFNGLGKPVQVLISATGPFWGDLSEAAGG
jgi:hypothetical protein